MSIGSIRDQLVERRLQTSRMATRLAWTLRPTLNQDAQTRSCDEQVTVMFRSRKIVGGRRRVSVLNIDAYFRINGHLANRNRRLFLLAHTLQNDILIT
jgi:hypothetical protein